MSRCGDGSLTYAGELRKVAVTQRCRCWSCDHCVDRNRKRLMALASGGKPTKFLTLTSRRRPGLTASEAARALKRAWTVVRQHWLRQHPQQKISFLAVFEKTKRGWPHLHITMRSGFIPQAWLSAQMRKLTGSPQIFIEPIDTRSKVAMYIAKYIGKDPERFKGCVRYWRSRDYDQRAPRDEDPDIDGTSSWVADKRCLITLRYDWTLQDLNFVSFERDRLIMEQPP